MSCCLQLKKGLSMVRKKGKLPGETISVNSTKEYGVDVLRCNKKFQSKKGEKVLIIDDILAKAGQQEQQ